MNRYQMLYIYDEIYVCIYCIYIILYYIILYYIILYYIILYYIIYCKLYYKKIEHHIYIYTYYRCNLYV